MPESLKKLLLRLSKWTLEAWTKAIAIAAGTGLVALTVAYWSDVLNMLAAPITIAFGWLASIVIVTVFVQWFVVHIFRDRRGRNPFKPIDVIDGKLMLLWRIKSAPEYWLDWDISSTGSGLLESVFEGPYCAQRKAKGHYCRKPMFNLSQRYGTPSTLKLQCSRCEKPLPLSDRDYQLHEVRELLARALQRHSQNTGKKIKHGLIIDPYD